ncbi:DUF308 domain-containing protein [Gordonia sp. NPDC003585]|uniref:HdeD family acid-resistance protein n=1 Tax=Gordonia sp. NPDC003585 TaxID=3154275 RepID=UPI0033A1F4E3
MTFAVYTKQFPDELIGAVRTAMIVTAIIGIVLGLIAVIWTPAAVLTVAILFAISLIIAGIFRIYQAFAATFLSGGIRFLLGIMGVIVLLAGIFALFSPEDAIWLLALFIGIGWIFQGAADLYGAVSKSGHAPTWFLVLSGVIAILAGIVMIVASQASLFVLTWIAGIMLMIISVVTLLTLPKKVDAAPAP